jgi:hypothetical protein
MAEKLTSLEAIPRLNAIPTPGSAGDAAITLFILMKTRSAFTTRSCLKSLAFAALTAALAHSAPKTISLKSGMGDFDMILDFERPGPDENVLEYSGDYLARKQPFRIFAEDWYYVKSGEFEGLAMEHYLERMNPGDEPGLHLFEQQFEAHLPNAKGDTLYMQTGRLTPEWKQGDDFYHEIRRKDGTRENDYAFIVAMDTLNRAFPDIPIPSASRADLGREGSGPIAN